MTSIWSAPVLRDILSDSLLDIGLARDVRLPLAPSPARSRLEFDTVLAESA